MSTRTHSRKCSRRNRVSRPLVVQTITASSHVLMVLTAPLFIRTVHDKKWEREEGRRTAIGCSTNTPTYCWDRLRETTQYCSSDSYLDVSYFQTCRSPLQPSLIKYYYEGLVCYAVEFCRQTYRLSPHQIPQDRHL